MYMIDSNDIIYGDYDLSLRLNIESGQGDESNPDFHTGELYVSDFKFRLPHK